MALLPRLALSIAILFGAASLAPVSAADAAKPESMAYRGGEFAGDMWQSGKEAVLKAWDVTKETAQRVWYSGKNTAREGVDNSKQTAQGAWDTTKEKTGEAARDLKEGWKDGTR